MEGWQSQPSGNTVQDFISNSFEQITSSKAVITGAGRTDAGVSALNYSFNLRTEFIISDRMKLLRSLNAVLPDSIFIKSLKRADDSFNARFDCKFKTYKYFIYKGTSPLVSRHWQITQKLDVNAMGLFIEALKGKHDFSTFCRRKSLPENAVINLIEASLTQNGRYLTIKLTGDRFLHNTVRLITGTAVDIGTDRINMSARSLLKRKDVKYSGRTAPADALLFYKAYY